MTNPNDIYDRITQKIIADLEKGELPWRKPWSDENLANKVTRPMRCNDIPYTGINTILLWSAASEKGFTSPYWMTIKQANDMNAHIKKGETGTTVVQTDKITQEERAEDGSTKNVQVSFLKAYTVFNAGQIEGLPEAFYKVPKVPSGNPEQRLQALENFFGQTQAKIVQGTKAAYYLSEDKIEMPEVILDAPNYFATLARELTHWTQHPSRLAREFGRKSGSDEGKAKEELVAELGACFLGADLSFEPSKEDHSAYIQSWLKVLKNDKRFIIQAASHANKAVEYVTGLQKKEPPEPPKPKGKGSPKMKP